MGPIDLLLHLAGFAAPAFFLALLLPVGSRWLLRRPGGRWWLQAALVFAAGLAVLAAGLWFFGRDGKMATYAALVATAASVQWLAARAWK